MVVSFCNAMDPRTQNLNKKHQDPFSAVHTFVSLKIFFRYLTNYTFRFA